MSVLKILNTIFPLVKNVFNESSTNQDVYKKLGQPIVKKCLDGYNGAILTYGQTNSGKSYTMFGSEDAKGVIELAIDDIFHEIDNCSDNKSFNLSLSFIEIYNEKIFDLLVEKKHELKIFESQGEAMTNQRQVAIKTKKEIHKILLNGNRNKHIASTAQNDQSSRSHTILSLNIESTNSLAEIKSSKLFLVDLAGSEKPDNAKASFNEGLHINKSLLALGKIIRQLTDKNVNVKNLRFRESVLTRLLSSCLGGNSHTSIICTANLLSLDETFYTICFARNAEKVKCRPVINSIIDDSKEVSILRCEVKRLQGELEIERTARRGKLFSVNTTYVIKEAKKRIRSELDETFTQQTPKVFIKSLTRDEKMIKSLQHELEKMKLENEQMKGESEKLKTDLSECNGKFKNIEIENAFLKSQIKREEQKKSKVLLKCKVLKEKLIGMKEKKLKENSGNSNSTMTDESSNYNEFIIGIAKKNEIDAKNIEIAKMQNELNVLKSQLEENNEIHKQTEEKIKSQLNSLLDAYQIIQRQLYENTKHIEQVTLERDNASNLVLALKENFKTSMCKTQEYYNILIKQKKEQEENFQQKTNVMKSEQLKDFLKMQEHYEKQFNALKICNHNQKLKIDQLEEKLNELNDSKKFINERKHEHEKIKFIKQHFEMKLCEKVKYYEKLLIEREKELVALKNLQNNNDNKCAAFGKLLITN
ncbi:hypothetical protein PVAND_012708 [Polypedilum vanderplanki]|uniref:Kinesin-like protein n=1 Tax=Polypedilum vanderplanki TaxID=319348 RepID=A0A9J6CMB4_POLVA|nr:hypothetical protein PVAND_012708 [Polypedilum vanderplanki]